MTDRDPDAVRDAENETCVPRDERTFRTPPLRGLEEWKAAARAGRPAVVVGNGPSSADVPPGAIPPGAVVVRTNTFFLEGDRPWGSRVDGVFWTSPRRPLLLGLEMLDRLGYAVGTTFSPTDPRVDGVAALVAEEGARMAARIGPDIDHVRYLHEDRGISRLVGWDRKPTQALLAVATLLRMGFRDIHVAGLDFYQASVRYSRPLPPFLLALTPRIHVEGGYDVSRHGLETDIRFLEGLRGLFPDARIRCLSPSSYAARMMPLSPLVHPPFDDGVSDGLHVRHVDDELGHWQSLCEAPFLRSRDPLRGGVEILGRANLVVWAWRPGQEEGDHRIVEVSGGDGRTARFRMDGYAEVLEMSGIGNGCHGQVLGRREIEALVGAAPWTFRVLPRDGASPGDGGIIGVVDAGDGATEMEFARAELERLVATTGAYVVVERIEAGEDSGGDPALWIHIGIPDGVAPSSPEAGRIGELMRGVRNSLLDRGATFRPHFRTRAIA